MILWDKLSFILQLVTEAGVVICIIWTYFHSRHKASRREISDLQQELQAFKLKCSERYIQREDWVPMTSRVLEILEDHTSMLARLDERSHFKHQPGGSRAESTAN